MCEIFEPQLLEKYILELFKKFTTHKEILKDLRKSIPIKRYKKFTKIIKNYVFKVSSHVVSYQKYLFKLGFMYEFWKKFFGNNCDKVDKLRNKLDIFEIINYKKFENCPKISRLCERIFKDIHNYKKYLIYSDIMSKPPWVVSLNWTVKERHFYHFFIININLNMISLIFQKGLIIWLKLIPQILRIIIICR